MIESALFLIERTITPIVNAYNEYKKDKTNMKYTDGYADDLKKLNAIAVSARIILENMKYTGNILDYLSKNTTSAEVKNLFLKHNFSPYEENIEKFRKEFTNELEQRFTVTDLIQNEVYTTWDFIFLAGFYSTQTPGILPVKNQDGEVVAVVARGRFEGNQIYNNIYLDNEEVKYYLIKGNHKYNDYILKDKVPIYLFETIGSNQQKYKGRYLLKNLNDLDSIILEKDLKVVSNNNTVVNSPKIKGRRRFRKNSGKKNPGSDESSDNKRRAGDRAEVIFKELLTQKNIEYKDTSKLKKYNFDVLVQNNEKSIGIEVKNISNGIFYMSRTEMAEYIENKTRLCFVDVAEGKKQIFISNKYEDSRTLKYIISKVNMIKEEVLDKHVGLFKISDIEIAIVNDNELDFNDDFTYVVDYKKTELLELLDL